MPHPIGPAPRSARDDAPDLRASTRGEVQERLAYDRTHLANERTYAAWLRTGLSIAAGGVAVAHLVPEPSRDSLIALALGSAFVLAGVVLMWYGARQFARATAALSRESGRAAPVGPHLSYLFTAALGALLLAVLFFLWTHQGRVGAAAARGAGADVPARTLVSPP